MRSAGAEELSALSADAVLARAARAHNVGVMRAALAAGADVTHAGPRGRTPLHAAVLSVSHIYIPHCPVKFFDDLRR